MAPLCSKWHGCFEAIAFLWYLQMIQITIEGEQASTGSSTQFDAHLLQSCAHAIGSQFWIFCQLLNFVDSPQRRFLGWMSWSVRLVLQSSELFFCPSFQCGMDSNSARLQIACPLSPVP